jgi:hypothetical protein
MRLREPGVLCRGFCDGENGPAMLMLPLVLVDTEVARNSNGLRKG